MSLFQYCSDLHLDLHESGNETKTWESLIPQKASYLILAGDVAQLTWSHYETFLQYCCQNWKQVFLVPGNHEYYNSSLYKGHSILKEMSKRLSKNFHLLTNQHLIIKEDKTVIEYIKELNKNNSQTSINEKIIHVLGCTLWSNIPPIALQTCEFSISDFTFIEGMTTGQYNFFHQQDVKWLENELKLLKDQNNPVVVVTHHAPLTKNVSPLKYESDLSRSLTNYAFCSNQSRMFKYLPKGSWWIFGHTHHRTKFIHQDINVTTNAIGYEQEIQDCNVDEPVFNL